MRRLVPKRYPQRSMMGASLAGRWPKLSTPNATSTSSAESTTPTFGTSEPRYRRPPPPGGPALAAARHVGAGISVGAANISPRLEATTFAEQVRFRVVEG